MDLKYNRSVFNEAIGVARAEMISQWLIGQRERQRVGVFVNN